MGNEERKKAVLHVLVIGFHHKRGSEVEFLFPGINGEENSHSTKLPRQWRFLPFLALPDGAHNYKQDTTFFHLPSLESIAGDSEKLTSTIYGISCYRQIDTKELKIKGEDVTRHTVQKSVCVLSCLPLFGYIREKLEVATTVYFDERDFSRTEILKELYKSLNVSLSPSLLEESLIFVGLPVVELVAKFRQRVLVLFKLLLLERKVIFHGFPVGSQCALLLALVSLVPRMIQSGLHYAAPNEEDVCPNNDNDDENEIFTSLYGDQRRHLSLDIFGFPLAIFICNSIFCPYLSLQQMHILKTAHVRSFVVGASNLLYKWQKGLSDVLVDLESGQVEIHDPGLSEQLWLSTADLRFTDYLVQHVNTHLEKEERDRGWDGSEDWIRAQFKLYLLSLLSTVQHTDGEAMANFNNQFVEAWKKTINFRIWREKEHAGIDDVHAGHPFQGQMGLSDIKIRLSNAMQDVATKGLQTARGRRIGQAVADTGKVVGGAINSARSYVRSWLSELTQSDADQNEDEAGTSADSSNRTEF